MIKLYHVQNQNKENYKIRKVDLIVINVLRLWFQICSSTTKKGLWRYMAEVRINSLCFVFTFSLMGIISNDILWSGGSINWSPRTTLRGGSNLTRHRSSFKSCFFFFHPHICRPLGIAVRATRPLRPPSVRHCMTKISASFPLGWTPLVLKATKVIALQFWPVGLGLWVLAKSCYALTLYRLSSCLAHSANNCLNKNCRF